MSGERSRELIARAVEAAQADRHEEARRLLERALASEPGTGEMIRAWRCLSEITEPKARRPWLEKLLAADPGDGYARRELAILNGQLRREDVIDPDRPQVPNAEAARKDPSQGLACPQCGSGRLKADPARSCLTCQHCGHRQPIETAPGAHARDVTSTLWTAKGRTRPRSITVFECRACGAAFIAAPGSLSASCPYCTTVFVADARTRRDLLEPDAILPFAISARDAHLSLTQAGVASGLAGLRGIYMPAWLLTFSGQVDWSGTRREKDSFASKRREFVSGVHTIVEVKVCVPASRRVPEPLHQSMRDAFRWDALVPYQPELLASWPAETYEISLEAAVVAGRQAALPAIRVEVEAEMDQEIGELAMTFARIAADDFQLVLVPLWFAEVERGGNRAQVFVNGQSGVAYLPESPGRWNWLSRWL